MSSRKEEAPRPRINQYALVRSGMILSVAIATVLAGYVVFNQEDLVRRRSPAGESDIEAELLAELRSLRNAWDPRQRERVLKAAPDKAELFAGTLNRVLRLPDHELLLTAIEYAAALGDPALRDTLVDLTTTSHPTPVRGAAILAAERLEPWSTSELAEFLKTGVVPIKLATLRAAENRTDAPWREVVDLILQGDGEVREVALATIPPRPPEELIDELLRMVESSDPELHSLGLRALAETRLSVDSAQRLITLLPAMTTEDQIKALTILTGSDLPESIDQVRSLAFDQSSEPLVQACALHYLERTLAFDPELVRAQVSSMASLPQYFAARCLVRSGDSVGVDTLIRLVRSANASDPYAVATACRQLLAWLTGVSPSSSAEEFELAFRRISLTDRGDLPAHGLEFDAF